MNEGQKKQLASAEELVLQLNTAKKEVGELYAHGNDVGDIVTNVAISLRAAIAHLRHLQEKFDTCPHSKSKNEYCSSCDDDAFDNAYNSEVDAAEAA